MSTRCLLSMATTAMHACRGGCHRGCHGMYAAPALGKLFILGKEEPWCGELLGAETGPACTVSEPGLHSGPGLS